MHRHFPQGRCGLSCRSRPGGGVDGAGRLISQKLSEALGRQFVVDNRPGANGMIGSELAAKAAKDGYTLMVNGANFVTTPSLYSKVTYDPVRDFEPVSLVALAPNVLVVHPSLPAKSVKELVALAKARPGEVNFAGSGSGSTPHLAGGAVQYPGESEDGPRPLPRHRPGDRGPDERRGQRDVHAHDQRRAAGEGGTAARARGHHARTGAGDARAAHGRGIRPEGLRVEPVVRRAGARGHAAGGARPAQLAHREDHAGART